MDRKYVTERLAPDATGIARAAQILRDGGLVAVPTETVSTDGPMTVAESGTQETQ